MESFFDQLERFLSGLTLGGFGGLTQDLHRREVITFEERSLVEERLSVAGKEDAGERLMAILKTRRDMAKLRAISQALQAFNMLYKNTKSQREEEKKKHFVETASSDSPKPDTNSKGQAEVAILEKFEDGMCYSHSELEGHLQEVKQSLDLTTITNFEGKTLLHLTCCLFTIDTVKLLAEIYGLDVSAKDNDGNTPLHDACRCRKTRILKYLLTWPKCNPNAQNQEGNTPLHVAIMHSHWEIARVLLGSKVVRVPIENNEGETPLTLVDMQLASPEIKKMRKDLASHPSVKKTKRQDSSKDAKKPSPLAVAKGKVQFSDAKNMARKTSTSSPSAAATPAFVLDDADLKKHLSEAAEPVQRAVKSAKKGSPSASSSSSLHVPSEMPGVSTSPALRKGVTMLDDVEVDPVTEVVDDVKELKGSGGFCVACLITNPPVICVLLLMAVGLALGCAVIGVAGALLLK